MPSMPSQSFSLLVSMPDEEIARHDLEGDSISIGRGPDNGIQILVSEVSVKHGELQATEEGFRIVDSGSTNGTKVNGKAVEGDGVELKPMDQVLLGATIQAYFVPSAVLESTTPEELIASLGESAPEEPEAKPAAAAPGAPPLAKPAPAIPEAAPTTIATPGAQTVKLDQVRPGAPAGPAQPPAAPGGVKPPLAKPAPVTPGKVGPVTPAAPAKPAAPAPGGATPKPVAPVPLKKPPAPGGDSAPAAPSVPLPKLPPKKEE